ncbi:MAG: hypothetical protein ACRDMV_00920 [Streptosporangiales bacterium]
MTAAQTLREVYGFDCSVCLDFGHLGELGPCPQCCPDAYAEHIAASLDQGAGVVA